MSTGRFILAFASAGFGATIGMAAIAFATGSTFGQRCDRAFPHDPVAAERCVDDLAHGRHPAQG